jgi:hypothetical protein
VDAVVTLRDGDLAYCPDLSFTATLDGVEQPIDWQTGWRCFGPSGATCVVPSVTFSAPHRAPDAQLVVADRSASLALPLGDLLVERSIALTGAPDWTFHPGQQVVLQWSAPKDLRLLGHVLVSFLVPCASCPGGEKVTELSSAPVDGTTIQFVAPSTTGSGKLSVEVQSLTIDYGTFYLSAFRTAYHAATIAP